MKEKRNWTRGLLLALFIALVSSSIYIISTNSFKALAQDNPANGQNASKAPSSTVIADFNRDSLANNLYGESGTWEKNPDDKAQWCLASLDAVIRRGESGSSLKLEYSVNSQNDAINGFWTQLRDFDASKYDHFEFWVKGDEKKGFTSTFKIEFSKFQKDSEGHDETIK